VGVVPQSHGRSPHARSRPAKFTTLAFSAQVPQPGLPHFQLEGLKQFGWIEGNNIIIEYLYADNRVERLPGLAAQLVRLNVDAIVAVGTLAPLAAKQATSTIPIVMTSAGDPLGSGLIESLARPGRNVTGLSLMAPDLGGKRLELLRQIVPGLARVAVVWNAANPYPGLVLKQTENAAQRLKIEVQSLEVRVPDDVSSALEAAVRNKADGLISVEDPLTQSQRKMIADFAINNRLPAMSGVRDFVDAGGLLSYGPDLGDLYRRAAGYVNKILNGAKPSDLPVEQPTKFELVINLKTAKALGLSFPQTLLTTADELIE
jgi:putative ABC transport system substrate-binding protein